MYGLSLRFDLLLNNVIDHENDITLKHGSKTTVPPESTALNIEFASGSIEMALIRKLNEDLLRRVFSLNTSIVTGETHDHNPISTLRRTSYVCASWRDLVLSSPTLWGQVIDVFILGMANDDWVKEVVRRTGQAWLYVTDSSPSRDTWPSGSSIRTQLKRGNIARNGILKFIFTHHWTRIKSLIVTSLDYDLVSEFEVLLQQPAPFLEVFITSDPIYSANPNLFANHAPVLRVFRGTAHQFATDAPWLSNLRSFHFLDVYTFTLHEILDILRHTPLLEDLGGISQWSLNRLDDEHEGPRPMANIILSRLTTIDVNTCGNMQACFALLEHITPSPGCRLNFTLSPESPREPATYTEEEIAVMYSTFSRYLKSYCEGHQTRRVYLRVSSTRGDFDIKADDFSFKVAMIAPQHLPSFVNFFFSDSNLRDFLKLLDTIEVLDTSVQMLHHIVKTPNEKNTAFFPSLQKVNILSKTKEDDVAAVFSFLEWMQKPELLAYGSGLRSAKLCIGGGITGVVP